MADSKKYNGSTWEHSLRKLTTATEAVENPLYSDGTAITAYTIKGNTTQSGTPSPDNPIMPQGIGDRTEQLLDYPQNNYTTTINDVTWTIENGIIKGEGYTTSQGLQDCILVLKDSLMRHGNYPYYCAINATRDIKLPAGTYTFSYIPTTESSTNASEPRLIVGHEGGRVVDETATFIYNGDTFTVDDNTYVVLVLNALKDIGKYEFGKFMLNSGSSALPFEPYGYKIPISSEGQTIDIYIGDLPLLKSLDGTAVDEISNGTLTRRVDSDGSVLPTPTTTQITMPSIPTTEGANSITVDTTVQPSEFAATWTGWHDASVKEWDDSQWNE